MELHDMVTLISTMLGFTYNETYIRMVFVTLAFMGGFGAMFSLCFDLGKFVYRAVRRLLRAALRSIRRRLKVHFQK